MFPRRLQKNIDSLAAEISNLESQYVKFEKQRKGCKAVLCKVMDKNINHFSPPTKDTCNKKRSRNIASTSKKEARNRLAHTSSSFTQPATQEVIVRRQSKDQVIHKEYLVSNPGGTIEVTVKSNLASDYGKKGAVKTPKPGVGTSRSSVHSQRSNASTTDKNKSGSRKPWSELLSQSNPNEEEVHRPEVRRKTKSAESLGRLKYINGLGPPHQPRDRTHADVSREPQRQNGTIPHRKESTGRRTQGADEGAAQQGAGRDTAVQYYLHKQGERKALASPRFEEKCIQWPITTTNPAKDISLEIFSPTRTLNFLMKELRGMSCKDSSLAAIVLDLEAALSKLLEESEDKFKMLNNKMNDCPDTDYQQCVNKCKNLQESNERLAQQVLSLKYESFEKDKIIANQNKKEAEYMTIIKDSQSNIEKLKQELGGAGNVSSELHLFNKNFMEENKVISIIKENHNKLQEELRKQIVENNRLHREIKVKEMEAQKHAVLLTGKDCELQRLREDIESFQKQIAEDIRVLKSNVTIVDIEKAMEAIFHRSELLSKTDVDSTRTEQILNEEQEQEQQDNQSDKLFHSSPTSTKHSHVFDLSCNQFSAIDRNQSIVSNKENFPLLDDSVLSTIRLEQVNSFQNYFKNKRESDLIFHSCQTAVEDTVKNESVFDKVLKQSNNEHGKDLLLALQEKLTQRINVQSEGLKFKQLEEFSGMSQVSDFSLSDEEVR